MNSMKRKSLSIHEHRINLSISLISSCKQKIVWKLFTYRHIIFPLSLLFLLLFQLILTEMLASSSHYRYHCHCLDRLPVRCHCQLLWLQHCMFQSICMAMEVAILAPDSLQQLQLNHCLPFATVKCKKKTMKNERMIAIDKFLQEMKFIFGKNKWLFILKIETASIVNDDIG